MRTVRFEQAVYGSFPFWDRGYSLLGHSPGCTRAMLDAFQDACRRYGEPHGGNPAEALFTQRLPRGAWLVVGVFPLGVDDRGRPGALAFHGLFVGPWEFRKVWHDPFRLRGALRDDWTAGDMSLPAGSLRVASAPTRCGLAEPERARIVTALGRSERVTWLAEGPIDDRAAVLWASLPSRLRRRRTLATWAYRAALPFDLVIRPRLDASDEALAAVSLPVATGSAAVGSRSGRWEWPALSRAQALGAAVGILGVALATLLAGATLLRQGANPEPPARAEARPIADGRAVLPPRAGRTVVLDRAQQTLLSQSLRDLCERFGQVVPEQALEAADGPTRLLRALGGSLRYAGPWLSADEQERLRRDPDPAAARALAWHAHLSHFRDDRPLPDDLETRSLPEQLAALAWSFRVDLPADLAPGEIPFMLSDALAMPGPVRPSPLAGRYPALVDYARFLARLPRR